MQSNQTWNLIFQNVEEFRSISYLESLEVVDEGVPDGLDLGGDDRQHWDVDAVELIKAAPGATLGQTREDLTYSLEKFWNHMHHIRNQIHHITLTRCLVQSSFALWLHKFWICIMLYIKRIFIIVHQYHYSHSNHPNDDHHHPNDDHHTQATIPPSPS